MRLIDADKLQQFPIRANRCDKEHANKHFINGIETVLEYAENLPAADVAPVVHGRKIEDGDIGCFWLCSLCGECLPYGANYCPNCGAKMDGGAEK